MDPTINSVVSESLVLQQAQAAQQAQLQVFRQALDIQQQQVSTIMESAAPGPQLASEGHTGTLINTTA